MKIRNFNDISVVDNGDDTLTFKHLIGEMQVPCAGGAYVAVAECGVGKSTGITELVKLFPKEAFAIFERTKADCDEARIRLIRAGVMPHEIIVLHGDSPDYPRLHNDPEKVSQSRIIIMPHIHLYTDFMPVLFAYDAGRRVDLEPYIADMTKLMKSDRVRRFILIDEAPDFVVPFAKFNGVEMTNTYSHYSSKCGRYGVDVDGLGKAFLNPMTQEQMERLCFSRVNKTPMTLYKDRDPHTKLKTREALHYIRQNFREIACKVNELLYHNLNDLVQHGSKANIYLFDATGAVLSNYRKSRFRPIRSSGKSYSSPITFEKFTMKVDRWKHESVADASTIAAEVALMADEIERQISTITGNLLVISWKYMSLRFQDPEKEDEQIDVISELDKELKNRSLDGRYAIIYRGSGDDRATNKFADYEAVTFLGEWKCGTQNVKNTNRNLGINSTELNHRVAGMVQAICRIRIRQHEGLPIKVFYSSDIDAELMAATFSHFKENSDTGVSVTGVPVFVPDKRDLTNIDRLRALCGYDSTLLTHVKQCKPYTCSIKFEDMKRLIPMREKKRRAYTPLATWLQTEYEIKLLLL